MRFPVGAARAGTIALSLLLLHTVVFAAGGTDEVEGHADNTGGDAHNQSLSEKRAAAVKAYLVSAGVNEKRLTTQGFGASQPVGSNDTALGRSQNRRVEIVKK